MERESFMTYTVSSQVVGCERSIFVICDYMVTCIHFNETPTIDHSLGFVIVSKIESPTTYFSRYRQINDVNQLTKLQKVVNISSSC